ncbi:Gfo/Idh/MocA family protein [Agrococcus baldri]|uniref:Oxidoreductase n=1 Tax=Agrococcus baldri TaxID=153730 RepID=A0AA87UQM5_9MICO|nr:Gfo/Idh/MocA family oxidoreductase [Agrococcus baldri]GEK79141.1 oxidoreductase [Agrococcus baldri]
MTDSNAGVLRVGIVGASAGNSWASRSHVPAIAATDGLRLTAVATSRRETALASAEQFGADHAFVGVEQMAASDAVDLIVVAVRVPYHREVVKAVLEAGKHVYCEWPLGVDRAEAQQMSMDALRAPGRNAVGLQARSSPAVRYLRDLVHDGYLGTVESCSITAFSQRGADPVTPAKRYLFDRSTGANLLTIETGHLVDAVSFVLGEPREIHSHTALRRPSLMDFDGGRFRPDTPDTVNAHWVSVEGALVSMHVAQGARSLFKTEISIIGSAGALHLSTTEPGGIQMAPLELRGATGAAASLHPLPVPERYSSVPDPGVESAKNVAEALAAFAKDIRERTSVVPDFAHAAARHATLEKFSRTLR